MRLLILRLANLFAKPQQHVFRISASGSSVRYLGMGHHNNGRYHSMAFNGWDLRQEGLRENAQYLVSNKAIAGATVLEYQGDTKTGAFRIYGSRAAVGLKFCADSLAMYFPIIPSKLYIKEDHV